MHGLKRAVRRQRLRLKSDRETLAAARGRCRQAFRRVAGRPSVLAAAGVGGFLLGMRRPAWKRRDSRSLIGLALALWRAWLTGLGAAKALLP
ncbi:hypothetical protein [Arhodomonas sp. AD133]|uniref:hypothetical protein n=1 Tax=Arhodomonas sp. AD133 TaxID=3415009 RepID=UPI003EBEEB55